MSSTNFKLDRVAQCAKQHWSLARELLQQGFFLICIFTHWFCLTARSILPLFHVFLVPAAWLACAALSSSLPWRGYPGGNFIIQIINWNISGFLTPFLVKVKCSGQEDCEALKKNSLWYCVSLSLTTHI